MRERLHTVTLLVSIFFVFLVSVSSVEADTVRFNPVQIEGGSLHPNGNSPLCDINAGWNNQVYLYSGTAYCANFQDERLIAPQDRISDYTSHTISPVETDGTPRLDYFGTFDAFNNRFFGLSMKKGTLRETPSSTFKIHEIRMCADTLNLHFSKNTGTPDKLTTTPTSELIDDLRSGRGYDTVYSFSIDAKDSRGSFCGEYLGLDGALQGYSMPSSTTAIYSFPMYCSNIEIEFPERDDDWDFLEEGRHSLIQIDDNTYTYALSSGDNYFRLLATYDGTTFTDYSVGFADYSSGIGGVKYSLYCDGIDINDDSELCLDEGGSFSSQYGCCLEKGQTSGAATCTDEPLDADSCQSEQVDGLCWSTVSKMDCTVNGVPGEQLVGDSLCCIEEMSEPVEGQQVFCDDGTLRPISLSQPFLFANNQWNECTEDTVGTILNPHLCYNTTPESYEWVESTCQTNGTGCRVLDGTEFYRAPINAWSVGPTDGACPANQRVGEECCFAGDYRMGLAVPADTSRDPAQAACLRGEIYFSMQSAYSGSFAEKKYNLQLLAYVTTVEGADMNGQDELEMVLN